MKGIDIAHYQNEKGKIDWTKVKQAGFEFVIIKCTEADSWFDGYFKENQKNAREAGMVIGYYHFARHGDYKKEADWFLSNIGEIRAGEFLALDYELSTFNDPADWCRNWLDYVESKVGFKPMLYTYHATLLKYDWKKVSDGNFGLWGARYGLQEQEPNEKYAPILASFPFLAIWQYCSKGIVTGIAGNVDLNYAPMKKETLMAYGKKDEEINQPNSQTNTMLILSQRDPRWAFKKLGKTNITLAKAGCVTVDVSMSLSWANCYRDPGYLAKYLKYTSTGLLYWASIADVSCMKFIWRGYPSNFKQAEIDEALKNPAKTCLGNVQNFSHWVLLIYRIPFTTKYWCADPWEGKRRFINGVGGYAILQKK